MEDRALVAHIARSAGQKAGYKQLVRELGLGGGRERRLLLDQLARLTARGQLAKLDREFWSIPQKITTRDNLCAGRLDLHRDGYGFVRPNARQAVGSEDIFIPPNEINGAMQGDQVLVEVEPPGRDGRLQGRIVRIVERRNQTIVGTFHYARAGRGRRLLFDSSETPLGNFVTPFDERMNQPILIPAGAETPETPRPMAQGGVAQAASQHRTLGKEALNRIYFDELEGLIVDVEITSWPTPAKPAVGRVVEVLGHPDDFGVDVEIMIRKHQLPRLFPDNVLEEARAVARLNPDEIARRRDFREEKIVTIDGATAKDFDDAVLVRERAEGGFELQVHIADVAEYVRPASALDLEARLRGTSVYFPDRAIPMLPHELSTNICSLRPNEDRLVLSCLMQLDATGRIEGYEIVEGVIRSAARMTYTEVHAILEGDAETRARYAELVPSFELMHRLAMLMNKRREQRGSIDFDLPEPVIEFDEHGRMSGVTKSERTWANRLIEEFMLAANECVATWLEDLGVPSLYRIHEKPEARRVVQFEELAAAFGYSLGLGPLPVKTFRPRGEKRAAQQKGKKPGQYEVPEEINVTPRMYQKLAARIEGQPEERILSYLMLRSLRQARYSESNEGHFALAAPSYTHFTSPIRRYPDLIVHRISKTLLRAGVVARAELAAGRHASPWTHISEGSVPSRVPELPRKKSEAENTARSAPVPEHELAQIADETSQTERRAAEAERELVEWKKVRFMEDRVGEEFDALVLNPTKYGLFVELTDLFIEGLVPLDSLRDDFYTFRENTHEVVGDRFGRTFRAGDRVQVVLERILADERRLQFSILVDGRPLTAPPRGTAHSTKALKKQQKERKQKKHSPAPWSARALNSRKGKSKGGGKNKGKRK
jgi:ribonuclease R